MDRRLLKLQLLLLAVGTMFSWTTLVLDYRRFFEAGGRVLEFSGCVVANPAATPCFYGAIAFLVGLAWAATVMRSPPDKAVPRQRGLHWLLLAGTLFAWGNFGYEVYRYLQPQPAPSAFSCPPGETVANPLTAPCFYGALIYLSAWLVSRRLLRGRR
jgi:hypothetical protein